MLFAPVQEWSTHITGAIRPVFGEYLLAWITPYLFTLCPPSATQKSGEWFYTEEALHHTASLATGSLRPTDEKFTTAPALYIS